MIVWNDDEVIPIDSRSLYTLQKNQMDRWIKKRNEVEKWQEEEAIGLDEEEAILTGKFTPDRNVRISRRAQT